MLLDVPLPVYLIFFLSNTNLNDLSGTGIWRENNRGFRLFLTTTICLQNETRQIVATVVRREFYVTAAV